MPVFMPWSTGRRVYVRRIAGNKTPAGRKLVDVAGVAPCKLKTNRRALCRARVALPS